MMDVKRLLIGLLFLALLALPAAMAEEVYTVEPEPLGEVTHIIDEGITSDEALEGYLAGLMGVRTGGLFTPRNVGGDLSGINRSLYDYLAPLIAQVAAGDRTSTAFEVPLSVLGMDGVRFTAQDLGVSRVITDEGKIDATAKAALQKKVAYDTSLLNALLWDHPYELYWFDKTTGMSGSYPSVSGSYTKSHTNDTIFFNSSMVVRFAVAPEFSAGSFTFNASTAQTAQKAAQTARDVVRKYAGVSDYAKLVGYKETICAMTSYNRAAAESTDGVYGNPWQLIWVFDGDASTTVVCEGYAKAFQYLCDMTDFQDDAITCYSISGKIDNSNHMWNIVHMPNNKNYHVDVTNCDENSVGSPDLLFMVGSSNGGPSVGYTFSLRRDVPYTYNAATLRVLRSTDLTLSEHSYLEDTTVPVDEAHFKDAGLRAAVASTIDTDGSGYLDAEEIAAATSLNISGRGVTRLDGVEYLTALTSLDATNNNLAELDVTLMPKLTTLLCAGNPLNTLDVSENATLTGLALSSGSRSVSGGAKRYASGSNALSCDLGVRIFTGAGFEHIINIPQLVPAIPARAFEGVAGEEVVVPDGCQSIGSRAFAACPNLALITIPASVSTIADDAFADSPDVFIVSPSATVRQWATSHGINSAEE